jgi:hypothetical protein
MLIYSQISQKFVTILEGGLVFYDTGAQGVTSSLTGIIRHYMEHIILIRYFFISLRLQEVFYFTKAEISIFAIRAKEYRSFRLMRDFLQIKVKNLRGPSFNDLLESEEMRLKSNNPLLSIDSNNILRQLRNEASKHLRFRALTRIKLSIKNPILLFQRAKNL